MQLTWLGHSCFLIESEDGTRIMTDPPSSSTGYNIKPEKVDAVTSSHDHNDHNNFSLAPDARHITEAGKTTVGSVEIEGFPSFHDNVGGAKRGKNIMYKFTVDGVRILHAGDLGQLPDDAGIAAIGKVDVLLVPVGGVYTIEHDEAREFANKLKTNIMIPMHYKTSGCLLDLHELAPLLAAAKDCAVHHMRQAEVCITPESLGQDRIIVLNYLENAEE